MRFIAIDSSLANTGIAIGTITEDNTINVDEIQLIETKKTKNKQIRASSDTIDRCRETLNFIKSALSEVQPQVTFAETPSGSQSASGMKSYGAVCTIIAAINPPPIEVTPNEVKMCSVGRKTASKRDMIDWAHKKYPEAQWDKNKDGSLKNKNEHMADAIAIVYAGIKTNEFTRLKSLMGRPELPPETQDTLF